MSLIEKLNGIEERYADLERRVSDPAIIANNREYAAVARERSQLEEVAVAIRPIASCLAKLMTIAASSRGTILSCA